MSAILVSSLFFAMFHMNLVQLPTPLLMGLILGFVTLRTRSVYPAILFHILNNTLRGALPLLMGGGTTLLDLAISLFTLALYVVGGIGLILICSLRQKLYRFRATGKQRRHPVGKSFSASFLSVGGILYLLLYLVMIVISFLL